MRSVELVREAATQTQDFLLAAQGRGRARPPSAFDRSHLGGAWEKNPAKPVRYMVTAGIIRSRWKHPAILDVGCGKGGLLEHFPRAVDSGAADGFEGIERYLGVDVSPVAIHDATELATAAGHSEATFRVVDVVSWRPEERFDVILFCDVLYHFDDPGALLAGYMGGLRPGGAVVVTLFRGLKNRLLWSRLRPRFEVKDTAFVSRGGKGYDVYFIGPAA